MMTHLCMLRCWSVAVYVEESRAVAMRMAATVGVITAHLSRTYIIKQSGKYVGIYAYQLETLITYPIDVLRITSRCNNWQQNIGYKGR